MTANIEPLRDYGMLDGQALESVWQEIDRLRGMLGGTDDLSQSLIDENERLRAAITKTLNKNGHLADGDNCTLIALKRAVPEWELPE